MTVLEPYLQRLRHGQLFFSDMKRAAGRRRPAGVPARRNYREHVEPRPTVVKIPTWVQLRLLDIPRDFRHFDRGRTRAWRTPGFSRLKPQRVGTVELAIPKVRQGSYFPDWLLVRGGGRSRLVSVVAQCYVEGVSTRSVDDVLKAMGIERISKSQVSVLAKVLDGKVAEFRNRPLDAGPYTYVWVDAWRSRPGKAVVS